METRGKFLFDDELIIHNGPVWKKKGGIYLPRKRQLIITDYPRIIYIDIEKMQQKGEIPWSSKIVIKCQNEKRFSVKVVKKIKRNGGLMFFSLEERIFWKIFLENRFCGMMP